MDFSSFMYSGANITGMRMVDLENPKATAIVDKWKKDLEKSAFSLSPIGRDQTQVSVSSKVVFSSLKVIFPVRKLVYFLQSKDNRRHYVYFILNCFT